jgi:integrase
MTNRGPIYRAFLLSARRLITAGRCGCFFASPKNRVTHGLGRAARKVGLIRRTLLNGGREPEFGPTKTGIIRTVDLSAETADLLREHKQAQAALKMRNRRQYHDLGLVFAKEWGDIHNRADSLGLPLQVNNIGSREFGRIIKAAGVKRIKFHGLRHTCATLMLAAGVPAHVVQRRLGHTKVEMTLNVYSHVLPAQQEDAATKLAKLLHG